MYLPFGPGIAFCLILVALHELPSEKRCTHVLVYTHIYIVEKRGIQCGD